jgi:transposase InsO family protein
VGKKLIQSLRRELGLKVRHQRPRIRRRGRSTGTLPTRADRVNHVWSWDFIHDRTDNGAKLKVLSLVDEHTRECLALHVAREIGAADLISVVEKVIAGRGAPACIRSDNGPEFISRHLQAWLAKHHIQTLYIEPGSPWQNGFVESFHARFRDECLNRELMLSVAEARVIIEDYRQHYNTERPHGGIGYLTPAQARIGLDQQQPTNLQTKTPLTASGPN